MEDKYYVSVDVWGDTGGGFEHITIQVHTGKYQGNKVPFGYRYRRKLKFYVAAHTYDRHEKFRAYVKQMCDNRSKGCSLERLRKYYFEDNDTVSIEDNTTSMINRGGPLVGTYHELVGQKFNCDLMKVDLSPVWDDCGPMSAISRAATYEKAEVTVANNMNSWRAMLVVWVIAIHYSMDMSC
jgi:hypothetical protein